MSSHRAMEVSSNKKVPKPPKLPPAITAQTTKTVSGRNQYQLPKPFQLLSSESSGTSVSELVLSKSLNRIKRISDMASMDVALATKLSRKDAAIFKLPINQQATGNTYKEKGQQNSSDFDDGQKVVAPIEGDLNFEEPAYETIEVQTNNAPTKKCLICAKKDRKSYHSIPRPPKELKEPNDRITAKTAK